MTPLCQNCLFSDQCRTRCGCDDYSPLDGDIDNGVVEQLIEDNRLRHRKEEWRRSGGPGPHELYRLITDVINRD